MTRSNIFLVFAIPDNEAAGSFTDRSRKRMRLVNQI